MRLPPLSPSPGLHDCRKSLPKRRPKSQLAVPPQETASVPTGSQPIDIPRRGSGYSTRNSSSPSSSSRAPPSGPHTGERVVRPLPTRLHERAASPRRVSESSRRSPPSAFSYYEPEFSFSVGSTAYDVTTLLPLRGATILSPEGAEPPPTSVSSAASPRSPEVGGSSNASYIAQTLQEPGSEPQDASRLGAEGTASALGTKRRRGKDKDSTSSEGSEVPHPPKSKKISIACNKCQQRKSRCDGQRPMCGACIRHNTHDCQYAAVARRRGPGKNVQGNSRRPGQRAGSSGSKPKARRGRGKDRGPSPPDASLEPSEPLSASGLPGPGLTASFPYARAAFEPQLSGPVPNYPGLAYRPPSYHPASRPFTFLSVRPGPTSRSTTSGSVSESVRSSTTTSSAAPSIPDIEELEAAYLDMTELDTYDEFQGLNIDQGRPPSNEPPQ
ncbi:hypothetical protein BD309DRAFT_916181 [Dichomitus squalens]|nr:hypothetical protein BD309DRAFT_916181 [Dichomitus squalens]